MNSPINLGNPTVNIFNQRFWNLHGWIDHVWGAFKAKGLSDTDAAYQKMIDHYFHMMSGHHHLHGLEKMRTQQIPDALRISFL